MKPPTIEVHIEELVLHGFPAGTRWHVADALQHELKALLADHGLPAGWQASAERIDAGAIRGGGLARPTTTGGQIARAVYHGGVR
jgi:hypothetical protein